MANKGDMGSIPESERSRGEGNGNALQYSWLENSMDRGVWWVTVQGVTELDMTEWLNFTSWVRAGSDLCRHFVFWHISVAFILVLLKYNWLCKFRGKMCFDTLTYWKMIITIALAITLITSAQFSSVQLVSRVRFFATPWTAACQASLSFTISWSLLKLMSIESVMPSSHLILCRPLLLLPSIFPSIRVFLMSQLFISSGQHTETSASASVLPMNIQGWFPLELTGFISLQSKGLSRVFSNTIVQKHQFFSAQLSLQSNYHIHT